MTVINAADSETIIAALRRLTARNEDYADVLLDVLRGEREACARLAKQAADKCGSAAEGEDAETMMRWLAGENAAHQIEAAINARST